MGASFASGDVVVFPNENVPAPATGDGDFAPNIGIVDDGVVVEEDPNEPNRLAGGPDFSSSGFSEIFEVWPKENGAAEGVVTEVSVVFDPKAAEGSDVPDPKLPNIGAALDTPNPPAPAELAPKLNPPPRPPAGGPGGLVNPLTAPEDPKLKLTLPNSSTEPEDWEPKPKEYMDDGEEVRERRPGFQDLGNCKRFWKAQQLIGTRKHKDQVWACQLF